MKIKHKSYEVICPVSGHHVFVRGLNIGEQNILGTPVTSYVQGLNVLLNVLFDAIQNPEVFKMTDDPNEDLYDSFLKQTYWDDLLAISIGVLNRMAKDKQTLDLSIVCQNTEAPELNEEGICGTKFTASFPYNRLITDIKINEEKLPIYQEKIIKEFPDYGVEVTLETPNLFKELILLDTMERLSRAQKIFKKLNISEYHKTAILGIMISINAITQIKSLEDDELVKVDFNNPKDEDFIQLAKVLLEFESLDEFTELINPDKYGLESVGETKCPKCGYVSQVDLKEWIINTFFPELAE